jgi:phospholipid/cholesterol/gamma-HCH transport system substrate-binding protein
VNEQIVKIRVGLFVLATGIILVILVLLFNGAPDIFKDTVRFDVHFTNARGVSRGTPVRYCGMLIGRVVEVQPAAEGGVLVTLEVEVDEKRPLRRTDECRIRSSLLGEAEIDFVSPEPRPRRRTLPVDESTEELSANET